ncbi:hypothetical protein C8R46DRAFT_1035126 [Mycena filopes]|nr:hypothetical protein C8R46DRAFT_1035126 [Mycena filopes]
MASASGSSTRQRTHSSVVRPASASQPEFVDPGSPRVPWTRIRVSSFRNIVQFFDQDDFFAADPQDVADAIEAVRPDLLQFRASYPAPPMDIQIFLQGVYRVIHLLVASCPQYTSQFASLPEAPSDLLKDLMAQKRVDLPTSRFKIPFISVLETSMAPPRPKPKAKPRVELAPPPPVDPPEAPAPKRTRLPPASRDGTAGQTPKSVVKSEPAAGTGAVTRARRTQAQMLQDETSSKLLPTPVPKKPSKSSVSKTSKRKPSPEVNPEDEQDPDFSPPPSKKKGVKRKRSPEVNPEEEQDLNHSPPPPKRVKSKPVQHVSFVTVAEGFAPAESLVQVKKKKRKKRVTEETPAEFMEDAPVASTSAVMLTPRKAKTVVVGPPLPPARPPSPVSPAVSPPASPRASPPIKSEFLNLDPGSSLSAPRRQVLTMPEHSNEGVSNRVELYQHAMIPEGDWAEGSERPVPAILHVSAATVTDAFIPSFASTAILKCVQCLLRGDDCGGNSISVTCPDCRKHKAKCSRTMEPIEIINLLDGLRPYFALAPDHIARGFVDFLNARRHSDMMAQLHARSLHDTELHLYSLLASFENQGRTLPADVLIRYFENPADVDRMVQALESFNMSAVRLVLAHAELRPTSAVQRHVPGEPHSIGNSYHTYGMPAYYRAFDAAMEPQELESSMANVFVPGQRTTQPQPSRQVTPAAHRAISSSPPPTVDPSLSTFSQANLEVHNTLNSLVAKLPPSSTTFPGPSVAKPSLQRVASGSLAIQPTSPTFAQVAATSPRDPTPLAEFDPEVEPSLESAAPSPPAAPSSPVLPPKSPTPPPKSPTPPPKAPSPLPACATTPFPHIPPPLSTSTPAPETFGTPTLLSPLSPTRQVAKQRPLTNFFQPLSSRKAPCKPASNAAAGPSTGGA